MNSKKLGDLGEKIALFYLKKNNYEILDKNYFPKFISGPQRGEIDIIAKKDNFTIFIEVKSTDEFNKNFSPAFLIENRINFLKKRKIIKMAKCWLMENKVPINSLWQIDALIIKINNNIKKAKIKHFKNIAVS